MNDGLDSSMRPEPPGQRKGGARFLLLLLAGVLSAYGEPSLSEPPDVGFPVGEKLTYHVFWGAVPVGESVATTSWEEYEGRWVLAIRFRSQTNRVLSKLYPVDDTIETLIDPATFQPIRFSKKLSEGRYRCDEVTHFDYEAGVARFLRKDSGRQKEYPVNEQTRDLVTFLYFMRLQLPDLELGVEKTYEVMADEKYYDIIVRPIEQETLDLPPFGEVETTRFEPEALFEGLFVRKGKMWIWVSNDERRILTRLQAKIPVASVKIQIAKVEGPGDDFWTEPVGEEATKKRPRRRRR